MNTGKLIFAQRMDHFQLPIFRKCVKQYPGSNKSVSFSYLDQFLCMAFAQLTYRESLRDIEACLRAHKTKLYCLGIRGGVACSTLADAIKQEIGAFTGIFLFTLSKQPEPSMPRIALVLNWTTRSKG